MNKACHHEKEWKFHGRIHPLTLETLKITGIPARDRESVNWYFKTGLGAVKESVVPVPLDTAALEADDDIPQSALVDLTYQVTVGIAVFHSVTAQFSKYENSTLRYNNLPTTTCIVTLFDKATSENFGTFVQTSWRHGYDSLLNQAWCDRLSAILACPTQIHEGSAGYWESRSDATRDEKNICKLNHQILIDHPAYGFPKKPIPVNFDYRHTNLLGINFVPNEDDKYGLGSTKCLTSQPLNDPRQGSVIVLFGLLDGKLLGVVDGTNISGLRTSEQVNEMIAATDPDPGYKVYSVGAGPIGLKMPETVASVPELPRPREVIL